MAKTQLALLGMTLILAASTGCNSGASDAEEARIRHLDSLQVEIDNSIQALEEKTAELERSLADLDTITVY